MMRKKQHNVVKGACLLGFFILGFMLTGCTSMFAEKTEVEIYNPKTGILMGRVFSNKGYTDFKCKARLTKEGAGAVEWSASKVNSDTVAQTALEANKSLSNALGAVLQVGASLPVK